MTSVVLPETHSAAREQPGLPIFFSVLTDSFPSSQKTDDGIGLPKSQDFSCFILNPIDMQPEQSPNAHSEPTDPWEGSTYFKTWLQR